MIWKGGTRKEGIKKDTMLRIIALLICCIFLFTGIDYDVNEHGVSVYPEP
jgi:hypothetical protein